MYIWGAGEMDMQQTRANTNRALLTVAAALGLWSNAAQAVCFKGDVSVDPTKGPVAPWDVEFRESQAVLIGTVGSERNIPDPHNPGFWTGTLYKLKVNALLKGAVGTSVEVFSENSSGRFPLVVGSRYVLFLRYDPRGKYWIADPCGNAAKLVYAF
jgi:hypothetical protein